MHYFQVHVLHTDEGINEERVPHVDEGMYDDPIGKGMHFFPQERFCQSPLKDKENITKATDEIRNHRKQHSYGGPGWKARTECPKYTDELTMQQQPCQSMAGLKDTGVKLHSELIPRIEALEMDNEWETVAKSEELDNELDDGNDSHEGPDYTHWKALANVMHKIEKSETAEEEESRSSPNNSECCCVERFSEDIEIKRRLNGFLCDRQSGESTWADHDMD